MAITRTRMHVLLQVINHRSLKEYNRCGKIWASYNSIQGRIQDFKLGGGAHLKKLRRTEGGTKMFGVFRVKNHDFTPKNHIFFNFRGALAGCAPRRPWIRPCSHHIRVKYI